MGHPAIRLQAGLGLLALLASAPAAGATYLVTSPNDVDDGTCDAAHCSLREAIAAANATAGVPDVIHFDNPALSGPVVIQLGDALPTIEADLVIDGLQCTGCGATQANSSPP